MNLSRGGPPSVSEEVVDNVHAVFKRNFSISQSVINIHLMQTRRYALNVNLKQCKVFYKKLQYSAFCVFSAINICNGNETLWTRCIIPKEIVSSGLQSINPKFYSLTN